jgi:hypothetical protein
VSRRSLTATTGSALFDRSTFHIGLLARPRQCLAAVLPENRKSRAKPLTTAVFISHHLSIRWRDAEVTVYGPYNRVEYPFGQTWETALKQVASGEIWGNTPKNGGMEPTVQAFPNRLAPGVRGIEFTTEIKPHPNGSPFELRWYLTQTPGVLSRRLNGVEVAAITVDNIVNLQPRQEIE